MGNKKRKYPNVEDILCRPWCYYCERDFEDLKLLISHQKAKHFKCDRCGRRLNTAGGLAVHLNQVHKETLHQVEHALPHRKALDVEIFGMEGIPSEILEQHRNRMIQNFYQAQEDRRIATGNIQPGQAANIPRKRIKAESIDELKIRLADFRIKARAQKLKTSNMPLSSNGPASANPNDFNPPIRTQSAYGSYPTDSPHGVLPGYPVVNPLPGAPYAPTYPTAAALPARPSGSLPALAGLPTRPSNPVWHAPGTSRHGLLPNISATVPAAGDDIDQLIRMAEAGIRPNREPVNPLPAPQAVEPQPAAEPFGDPKLKKDKDKSSRMVFAADDEISPEEKMAKFARYTFGIGS